MFVCHAQSAQLSFVFDPQVVDLKSSNYKNVFANMNRKTQLHVQPARTASRVHGAGCSLEKIKTAQATEQGESQSDYHQNAVSERACDALLKADL